MEKSADPTSVHTALWPVANPPSLDWQRSGDESSHPIADSIQDWMEDVMANYLPEDVGFGIVAPLEPIEHRLQLVLPHFVRNSLWPGAGTKDMALAAWINQVKGASILQTVLNEVPSDKATIVILVRKCHALPEIPGLRLGALSVPEDPNAHSLFGDLDFSSEKITKNLTLVRNHPDQAPAVTDLDNKLKQLTPVMGAASGDESLCRALVTHQTSHPYWAPVFSPVLSHGAIVLIWAPSLSSAKMPSRSGLGAAAATFLVRNEVLSNSDVVNRMVITAHELDGFMGTAHQVAVNEGRQQAALEALDILKHSLGNLWKNQNSRSEKTFLENEVAKLVLAGAMSFAEGKAEQSSAPWGELGFRNQESLAKSLCRAWRRQIASISVEDAAIEDLKVDLRVIPLLDELIRNLDRWCPTHTNAKLKFVTCNSGRVTVIVHGCASQNQISAIEARLHAYSNPNSKFKMRGLVTILKTIAAIRSDRTLVNYTFGSAPSLESSLRTDYSAFNISLSVVKAQNELDDSSIPFEFSASELIFQSEP